MSEPLRLTGTPASGGYAEGPIFCLDSDAASYVAKGSPAAEADALKSAIDAASEQLAVLAAASTGDAADMLEFQLAMLADDSLSAPAFDAIEAGTPADKAWSDALAGEIAGYEAAEDEYFRARAADLKDIRQQVLDALTSAGGRHRSAGRDPVRRGHRADAFPGDGLVGRRRHRALEGQFGEPCGDAGALARRADGGRARERCERCRRPCPARRRAWRHRAQAKRRRHRGFPQIVERLWRAPPPRRRRRDEAGDDRQRRAGARAGQRRRSLRRRPHRHRELATASG